MNVSGGTVGDFFDANSGSEVNISGGEVGAFFDANGGATVNIIGGTMGIGFRAYDTSTVNIFGGGVASLNARPGSTIMVSGEEFQIDGQLVPGLDQVGAQVQVNMPFGSVVVGVLSDGGVVAFGNSFPDGTLTLVRGPDLPPVTPVVNVPFDLAPRGLRGGQTLNLNDGGALGDDFNTLANSVVNVMGGTVGGQQRLDGEHLRRRGRGPVSTPTAARQ